MKNGHYTNGHDGNGHAPKRHFNLLRFDDISLNTQRRDLVRRLIPREGIIVIWGPPKCGKSFLVTDLAFHVALGREYRGRKVSQGSVVYVACEGQFGFDARIEAFRQEHMGEEEAGTPFYLVATRLDLRSEYETLIYDIAAQLPNGECSLIVLDTLNRSLTGSENSDEDMSAYIEACDKIKERFHCAVVIIHHCGVEGTRPRGHTSLAGAVDAQIKVEKDEAGTILATVERMKEGPEGDTLESRLRVVEVGIDEEGDTITSCVIEPAEQAYQQPEPKPDQPRTQQKSKVPPSGKLAITTLKKALAQDGRSPPASNHIPQGKTVVSIDLWRRHHYLALGNDMNTETKKKDFQRTRRLLQDAGIAQIHDDVAWLV